MARYSRFNRSAEARPLASSRRLPSAFSTLVTQALQSRSLPGLLAPFGTAPDRSRRFPAVQVLRPSVSRSSSSAYKSMLRVFADVEPTYRRSTLCDSRRIRREVLYAKNIAGFRGRSPGRFVNGRRSYRRGANSYLSCMR